MATLNYPARCVSECLEIARLPGRARALDLGCAVGRSTFELARNCSEVIGIDYSHRFIEVARRLQQHGSIGYAYVEEGLLTTPATAAVPPEIDRHRVTFESGDAQSLRPDLGSNPEFNLLFKEMESMENTPQRLELIRRLVDIARRDAPWVWGYHPQELTLYHRWVLNAKPHAIAQNTLKYLRSDPSLRSSTRLQWNRPLVWPVAGFFILLAIPVLPFLVRMARKNRTFAGTADREPSL